MGRDMYAHPEHEKPCGVGMSGQNMDGSGRAFQNIPNYHETKEKKSRKNRIQKKEHIKIKTVVEEITLIFERNPQYINEFETKIQDAILKLAEEIDILKIK